MRNPPAAPVLEITLSGPTFEVLVDATIAITGADMSVIIDGRTLPNYHSARVSPGSTIAFGRRRYGARAYLAVNGGFAPSDSNVGLRKGDILPRNGEPRQHSRPLIHLPESEIPTFESPAVLRVIEGPHWDRLSASVQGAFVAEAFTVDIDSNRVGIRLSGTPLGFAEGESADVLSEPTPIGTIQLPASGQPIVLMTDRPVTGGYAKIATVITADIPRAAQLAPVDSVRFQLVSLAEAHAVLKYDRMRIRLLETVTTWQLSS